LSKWRSAGLDFVFGIDVSKDNIFNNKDGACARYLSDAAKFRNMPGAIFLHGNSALNIRSGEAFEGYKEQNIARALFGGEGNAKRNSEIGKMVGKYTGIVGEGFNVSSCQFALHYFFENVHTMHNFMRNVSECTRIGGTFIGTCWDGKLVFDTLRPKMCGESYTIKHPDTKEKVFEIIKLYENTAFPADELSLGYSISVYQESIGQHIVEYLVNFDFLCSIMEKYGFKLMNPSESTKFGFPKGTGTFRELYNQMITEYQQNPNAPYGEANMMTHYERTISFFNRYFIFKKMRNVNTEEFTNILRSVEPKEASKCVANATFESDVYIQQDREELESRKDKSATQTPAKKKEFIRKLDIQIIIKSYHPVQIDENGLKQGPGNKVIIRRKTASSGYPLLADTLGKEKMREYIDRIHTEIPITRYDAGYDRVFEVVSDEPGDYTRAVQEREILKTKLKLRKNGQVITLPSFVEVWNDPNSGLAKEILDSNNPHEAKWALQIKYGYKIATTFMPMYAKAIYDYFQGGSVLDPCAGWGDRMLGALLSNNVREYVGFDPNRNLLAGYAKIQEDVGYKVISQTGNETVYANETGTGVRSTIYSMPFEESEKVLKMRKFDFAFTSPPFFDYEDYSDKNPKYTNWYTQFYEPLFKIVERHLNAGSIFAIHIGDTSGGKIMEFLHETVPKITNFVMVDKIGLVGGKSGKIRDVHVFRLMDGRR
jgi:hypothetical protein